MPNDDGPISTITITKEYGQAYGFVCTPSGAGRYLVGVAHAEPGVSEVIKWLGTMNAPMAILIEIKVKHAHRGEGRGSELLSDFIERTRKAGVKTRLLIANLAEPQARGFSLIRFYQKFGFMLVADCPLGRVMVESEEPDCAPIILALRYQKGDRATLAEVNCQNRQPVNDNPY